MSEHTCTRHRPGQATCYIKDACRCDACRAAATRDRKERQHFGRLSLPAVAGQRRLQALGTLGWTMVEISQRTGLSTTCLGLILRGRNRTINRPTYRLLVDAYDALWDVEAPASPADRRGVQRMKNRAVRLGWAPPMAWDDSPGPHYIDDPDAKPWRPEGGRDRRRIDMIADAAHQGHTVAEVAAEIGVQPAAIYTACRRAGELDLWERLTGRAA